MSSQQQQPHTRTSSVPHTISTSTSGTSSSNSSPVHSRNGSYPILPTKSPGNSPTFPRSSRPSLNLATPPPQAFPSRFPRSNVTTPNQTTDSPSDYFQSPGTPYAPSTPESGTSLRRSGAIGHSRSSSRSSVRVRRDSSLQSSRRNSLTTSAAFPPTNANANAVAAAAAASSVVKRQSSAAHFASASVNASASRSSSTGSSVSNFNTSLASLPSQRIRTTSQSANAPQPPPSSVMAVATPPIPSENSQDDARPIASTSALPPTLPPSITDSKDSPHSQRPSPDSLHMPDVPRRRSSVHRLRLKDGSSAPPSPLPSPHFQQEKLQTDSPAAALTPSQSTTADSSDLSDYGSQADEEEVYQDSAQRAQGQQLSQPSRAGSTDATAAAAMENDLSDAIKLAGGPPKLQRRQRDPSRAAASSPANRNTTSPNSSTPPSSEQPSFDSQPTARGRRSQSPRKPRISPSDQASGSPGTHPVEATPLARDAPLPTDADLSPPRSPTKAKQSPDATGTPPDDAALEAEAQRLADLENPDRPKTLKEARELAKARARARKVQPTAPLSPGGIPSSSRPTLQPSQSNTSVMDELQAAVGDALQDLSFGSTISDNSDGNPASSGGLAPNVPGSGSGTTTSQSTSGLARSRETSFDSARSFAEQETAAADDGRFADADSQATPEPQPARLPQSESARTIRTVQGDAGPSGLESGLTLGEALDISAPVTPRLPADVANANAKAIPSYPAGSREKSPMANYRLAQSPFSGPQVQPRSSSNAPPQRTLISLNTRINVPGKTVPYPPAMNAQSVSIDKRKLPPWERARAYATFVNELASMPSGLTTWMEMAQKQPRNTMGTVKAGQRGGGGPRYPSTFGVGGESGTYSGDSVMTSLSSSSAAYVHPRDASGASVRSDMTFPMRGDGGRARDVTQVPFDRSAPDSMPDAVPSNIPYPTLVHQHQQHSNQGSLSSRTGSYTAASAYGLGGSTPGSTPSNSTGRMGGLRARKLSNSALDALGPLLGGSGQGASTSPVPAQSGVSATPLAVRTGLLSSLGRRGSKRNATVHPSMSSTNSSGSVSGPRGPRSAANRFGGAGGGRSATMNTAGGGSISSPFYSSPSSSSVIDLGAMAKDPEQAGLGLGLTRSPADEASPGGGNGLRHAKSNAKLSPDGGTSTSNGYSRGAPQQTSPSLSSGPRQGSGGGTDHGTTSGGGFLSAVGVGSATSSRKNSAASSSGGADGGHHHNANSEGFKNALQRVSDVFPDADEDTLVGYLKRAQGDDLKAIGDYLNDQALGSIKRR